jgi:hypothetical protein
MFGPRRRVQGVDYLQLGLAIASHSEEEIMRPPRILSLAPLAVLLVNSVSGQTKFTVAVPATANIFAAGQSSAFSGELPPVIAFPAGSVAAITLEAVGAVTLGGGEPYSSPAGIPFPGGTDLTSIDGLSGIIALNSGFFLTGVFLDDSAPAGAGPPILNFTDAENFLIFCPLLSQTFYAGNGFTGDVHKVFVVPKGATRLFLGIADGCVLAGSAPGCYQDNVGEFFAQVTLHLVTKQPSSD